MRIYKSQYISNFNYCLFIHYIIYLFIPNKQTLKNLLYIFYTGGFLFCQIPLFIMKPTEHHKICNIKMLVYHYQYNISK